MLSYKPPYTITPSILNKVAVIMKHVGMFSSLQVYKHQPLLRRKNRIKSIHASLAIEQNQLTESQVHDLLNGKVVIGPKKDILEVQNAIKVYESIEKINPYDQQALLFYHKLMMEGLILDAGMYRHGQIGVFKDDIPIFIAPPSDRVPSLMNQLFQYLHHDEDNLLIKSCVFHYEFEFIHPFSDGNGRMGRLFQTCLLGQLDPFFYGLPIESIIKEKQSAYYKAILQSTQQGSSTPFIEFMLDAILDTLVRAGAQSMYETTTLSTQSKKLISQMQDGVPYTTLDMMNLVRLKSRVSFLKHYLTPLLKAGMIEMTLKDTPRSKHQRYLKK